MHSSRMRTAHLLTVWGGGSAQPRGCVSSAQPGGALPMGVCIGGGLSPTQGDCPTLGVSEFGGSAQPGVSASRGTGGVCIQGVCPTQGGSTLEGVCLGGLCIWGVCPTPPGLLMGGGVGQTHYPPVNRT